METKKLISVVLPLFNEEKNVEAIVDAVFKHIDARYALEIILVNDGSSDNTSIEILKVCERDPRVKGILFYKNFGHQPALIAGLEKAKGDAVITMDSDFQHPPEKLPELIALWEQGHDLVMARKEHDNKDDLITYFIRKLGYLFYKYLSSGKMVSGVSDFRLTDKILISHLKKFGEYRISLRALFLNLSSKPAYVLYNVGKRRAGRSGYNLYKLYNLYISSITSFSLVPLRGATIIGILLILFSFAYLFYILFVRFVLGYQIIQGWTALIFVVIVLFGFMFFYLGLLGEYIGTIFEEVKGRPKFLVKSYINFDVTKD